MKRQHKFPAEKAAHVQGMRRHVNSIAVGRLVRVACSADGCQADSKDWEGRWDIPIHVSDGAAFGGEERYCASRIILKQRKEGLLSYFLWLTQRVAPVNSWFESSSKRS